jgi:hypothetical protein
VNAGRYAATEARGRLAVLEHKVDVLMLAHLAIEFDVRLLPTVKVS